MSSNFKEEDIIEISSGEIEGYANLIFSLKIRKFAFYERLILLKNEKIMNKFIMYGSDPYQYFSYGWNGDLDENILFNILYSTSRRMFPAEGKENNIEECLFQCDESFGEGGVVKFWCPELYFTNEKPAKREV